LAAPMRMI